MTELDKKQLRGRILVVDDEPQVRSTLREALALQDHVVAVADSAENALQEIEKGDFDLVISDLHLPGLNGVDMMVRIKASHPTVPVVVVTGQPALHKAIDAMKKGASDFLTKPFSIEQIHQTVHKNLKERQLVKENQRLLAELNNKAVIEKLNRQLHQKIDQLTKLFRISESFHSSVSNHRMLQYVVDLAAELLESERVSLLTFDQTQQYLMIRASRGISTEIQRKACLKVGEGVAGRVAMDYRPVRVTSKRTAPGNVTPAGRPYESQSWLSVPLFIGGELFGVLNLTNKHGHADYTEEDEYLALTLAEKAGIKIENNVLYEGIYANLLDTLKALVSTIEAKDTYTRHHSQRVTDVALVIARHAGCSEEDCESIAFAGILHDIGKIGISDSILLKTSRLTGEEYEEIKNHPAIGEKIVMPLGLIEAECDIIRHHHERVDGRGYPD
ncbi:MAG: response regulator, partial [Candidatus Sumerlaeota bacterium]